MNINKKKYDEIIAEKNRNKIDKWYCLKDLVRLKGISYRSLKYMVQGIHEKYKNQGSIYKSSGRYYIKYNLIDEFKLKQPRKTTKYSHPWKSNISYTTRDRYDLQYHQTIITEIRKAFPDVQFEDAIEADKTERLHVHMICDAEPESLKPVINNILMNYLENDNHFRLYCEPVVNKACSIDYLKKNNINIKN